MALTGGLGLDNLSVLLEYCPSEPVLLLAPGPWPLGSPTVTGGPISLSGFEVASQDAIGNPPG